MMIRILQPNTYTRRVGRRTYIDTKLLVVPSALRCTLEKQPIPVNYEFNTIHELTYRAHRPDERNTTMISGATKCVLFMFMSVQCIYFYVYKVENDKSNIKRTPERKYEKQAQKTI